MLTEKVNRVFFTRLKEYDDMAESTKKSVGNVGVKARIVMVIRPL